MKKFDLNVRVTVLAEDLPAARKRAFELEALLRAEPDVEMAREGHRRFVLDHPSYTSSSILDSTRKMRFSPRSTNKRRSTMEDAW